MDVLENGNKAMDIAAAQSEVRIAYLRGGPGSIIAGLVWLAAGITATRSGISIGFAVLFFGGMLIFPITTLIIRVFFRPAPTSERNPGGLTVMETVFTMIGGFLGAWLLLPYRPDFVFPLAAIAVGTHYFGFRTVYGDWIYWALGAIMSFVGIASIFMRMPTANGVAYVIAAIEIAVGCWFTFNSIAGDSLGASASAHGDSGG